MANKNEHVVIALFDNDEWAQQGVRGLKNWDRASEDIKLGTIGTITKEGDKVKTHVGGRKVGKGAAVGASVGLISAVLTWGSNRGRRCGSWRRRGRLL